MPSAGAGGLFAHWRGGDDRRGGEHSDPGARGIERQYKGDFMASAATTAAAPGFVF